MVVYYLDTSAILKLVVAWSRAALLRVTWRLILRHTIRWRPKSRAECAVIFHGHERIHRKLPCLAVNGELEAISEKRLQHQPQFWLWSSRPGLAHHVESGVG